MNCLIIGSFCFGLPGRGDSVYVEHLLQWPAGTDKGEEEEVRRAQGGSWVQLGAFGCCWGPGCLQVRLLWSWTCIIHNRGGRGGRKGEEGGGEGGG